MIKWFDAIEDESFLYYLMVWSGILFALFLGLMTIIFPIIFAEYLPIWLIIFIDVLLVSGTAFFAAISTFLIIEY